MIQRETHSLPRACTYACTARRRSGASKIQRRAFGQPRALSHLADDWRQGCPFAQESPLLVRLAQCTAPPQAAAWTILCCSTRVDQRPPRARMLFGASRALHPSRRHRLHPAPMLASPANRRRARPRTRARAPRTLPAHLCTRPGLCGAPATRLAPRRAARRPCLPSRVARHASGAAALRDAPARDAPTPNCPWLCGCWRCPGAERQDTNRRTVRCNVFFLLRANF